MAYEEKLADTIRQALAHVGDVKEKRMFGGLAFMVDDKMCITVGADRIMCRIDPALHDEVLEKKSCRTVIMRGREYRGYVHVDKSSISSKNELDYWLGLALDYNKVAKSSKSRKANRGNYPSILAINKKGSCKGAFFIYIG